MNEPTDAKIRETPTFLEALTLHSSRLDRLSRLAGSIVPLGGLAVLIGWAFDLEGVKRILPGLASMNPTVAVAFILAGLALTPLRLRTVNPGALFKGAPPHLCRRCGQICAGLVMAIGGLKLAECCGLEVSVDQWLFAGKLDNDHLGLPNRMAPNAALNFVLIGTALMLLDSKSRRGHRPAQYLAAAAGFVSLLALIGYAYQVPSFYGIATYMPMALPTAAAFMLLSIGVLCARPNEGWMTIVTSESPGGVLMRTLLPATIAGIIFLGWLRLDGERHGLYGTELGVALYTAAVIVIFAVLVVWTAASLHGAAIESRRIEEEKEQSAKQIQHLNEELSDRAAELEAANKELEAFSYSVSHDLRAPLRHVQGFVELLGNEAQTGQLSPKAQRYLKIISDSAGDMGMLIDDLLTFARVGRVEMRQTEADIEEIVAAAIAGLDAQAAGRNIVWKNGTLPMCQGDPALIKQVFVNLIGNALKYSRPRDPAVIEIGCAGHDEEGRLILFVRDNGVGFDMQYADKLFGVFQRLHRADEFEGTGVGLANVSRIVARHGGRIWAEAKLDEGATFFFTLKPSTTPSS